MIYLLHQPCDTGIRHGVVPNRTIDRGGKILRQSPLKTKKKKKHANTITECVWHDGRMDACFTCDLQLPVNPQSPSRVAREKNVFLNEH